MFAELSREFAELFTFGAITTLIILTALETVLGFDNLLYISIEAKRVQPDQQARVRKLGTLLAIVLRIVLLFVVLLLIQMFQSSWFKIDLPFVHGDFNGHSLIVLAGGLFLINTALKEIRHMLSVSDLEHEEGAGPKHRSVASAIFWILVMNIVFSFDTVLSAVALTKTFIVNGVKQRDSPRQIAFCPGTRVFAGAFPAFLRDDEQGMGFLFHEIPRGIVS